MNRYEFTIIASGLDPDSDDFEDRFFEAGCDDTTIAFVKGRIVIEFAREARNFSHALFTAIQSVQRAGATVEHIEPDYLVSLSDIAERCDLSRAAISLFAKGERGEAFPAPVARVSTESSLWDWVAVARWMFRRGKISLPSLIQAKIVRDVNCAVLETQGHIEYSRFGRKILDELAA
jgi:TATA-box binding protein (TBP) (component of TFIID and TFIIIB)